MGHEVSFVLMEVARALLKRGFKWRDGPRWWNELQLASENWRCEQLELLGVKAVNATNLSGPPVEGLGVLYAALARARMLLVYMDHFMCH